MSSVLFCRYKLFQVSLAFITSATECVISVFSELQKRLNRMKSKRLQGCISQGEEIQKTFLFLMHLPPSDLFVIWYSMFKLYFFHIYENKLMSIVKYKAYFLII